MLQIQDHSIFSDLRFPSTTSFIRSFKTMCDKQELKHSDFWNVVVRKEGLSLGLITKEEDESGGADAVEVEEAEEASLFIACPWYLLIQCGLTSVSVLS